MLTFLTFYYILNNMTDQELKELVASLVISQQKTDEQLKKTDRIIKNMSQDMGGLGRKFGGFTEGMAFPSLTRLLQERFQMDVVSRNISARKNGKSMELDVLAYSNSNRNEIYVGEIKSRFRDEDFKQMKNILNHFFDFFPSYKGKKLYGILTVVDVTESLKKKILKEGIYLACIHDNEFELVVPPGFKPRAFQ